jgi:hypothetical protein
LTIAQRRGATEAVSREERDDAREREARNDVLFPLKVTEQAMIQALIHEPSRVRLLRQLLPKLEETTPTSRERGSHAILNVLEQRLCFVHEALVPASLSQLVNASERSAARTVDDILLLVDRAERS